MDEHLNFRWLGAFEGAGGFQMESGINTPAAVRGSDGAQRRPAIIISSSPHKRGSSETPWQDFFRAGAAMDLQFLDFLRDKIQKCLKEHRK